MPIPVTCKSCEHSVKVADTLAGKAFKCPKCTGVVRVPAAGGAAPTASTPQALRDTKKSAPSAVAATAPERKRQAPPPEDDLDFDDRPARRRPSREEDDFDESRSRRNGPLPSLSVEHDVPEHLQERIAEELSKGEKLIWVGQPSRGIVFKRSLFAAIGAGVIFFIILIVLVVMGINGAGIAFLPAFVFLILMLGAGLSPFYKIWRAKRTCYAVTNRRAIVWFCQWHGGIRIDNYTPGQLTNMRRADSWFLGKGAGDLIFRSETTVTVTTGKHGGVSRSTTNYGFLDMENVRDVEKMVRETLLDRFLDKLNE